jgi:hypothetical protein
MNIFEIATRKKLRFDTTSGQVSTEDLWDVTLSGKALSLDNIAKSLNKQLKESAEESFVVKASAANTELQLKFDIVKHIIDVKLAEKAEREAAAEKRALKEKLLAIRERKADASLESKTLEELDAELAKL